MAYQIKRRPRVKETLELCNAEGNVVLSVDADVDVEAMGGRIAKAQDALREANALVTERPDSLEAREAFGKAVVILFALVFGEEGAGKIVTYYEGRYAEMLIDVFPFLNDVVMPAVQKASADRKRQLLQAADAMRRK